MKKNITLILFFILIFVGVALLGYTPALAAKPTTGEYMTPCSGTEITAGICAQYKTQKTIAPYEDIVAWVVRPWIKFGDDDIAVEEGDLGNGWPWFADGVYHYGYQGGITEAYWNCYKAKECASLSSASYTLTITNASISGSYPSGAFMNPDNVPCEGLNIGGALQPWKLNPDMTFRHLGFWDVQAATDLVDYTCGQLAVIFSSECWDFKMVTALGNQVAGYESQTTRTCGDVSATVDWDQCTLKPTNVTMYDSSNSSNTYPVCHTRYGGEDYPWIYVRTVNPDTGEITLAPLLEPHNCGPQQGCLICTVNEYTGQLEPLFLHGNDAYRMYTGTSPGVCLP